MTAGAAVIAAVSIPLDRAGVGWLVAVVAGTVALAIAAYSRAHPSPQPANPQPAEPNPKSVEANPADPKPAP